MSSLPALRMWPGLLVGDGSRLGADVACSLPSSPEAVAFLEEFAIGRERPRSFPRLATPTPHVSVVLYPVQSLPISRHCVPNIMSTSRILTSACTAILTVWPSAITLDVSFATSKTVLCSASRSSSSPPLPRWSGLAWFRHRHVDWRCS